jgi:hypothetical protein
VCAAAVAVLVAALVGAHPLAAGADPAVPFGLGERLVFSVKYGPITAGTGVLAVEDTVTYRNRLCYHLVSQAFSSDAFSVFFKVVDQVESYLDAEKFHSLRFEKHLSEGDFTAEQRVDFDQDAHTATYNDDAEEVYEIPPDARDALAALYYVRTLPLVVGRSVYVESHADRKNYPLEVKVLRRETVTVPAGTFDCLVTEPILRATGIFKHKGTLTVYLTNDSHKMPVLMKSKVAIGSISAALQDWRLGTRIREVSDEATPETS